MKRLDLNIWVEAVSNSYSMVFFSTYRWFSALIILLTFMDPLAGLAGLFSVLVANGLAFGLGLNLAMVRQGAFGFNALLVGLGLGAYYHTNLPLYILLAVAALITFFVTVLLHGILAKYKLPYISLPFVLALWAIMLASRAFESLGISQRGLYLLNELYAVGDHALVNTYAYLQGLAIPLVIKTYLRSLGAILFQFNALSGLVLAIGLLLYSRIGFVLSLLGFFAAWFFYQLIGADLNQLNYNYIGFNYILSAIAIGGFFLVPSRASFLWALVLIPVLAVVTTSSSALLATFGLGPYSLPFNLVVISFLYVLKWRVRKGEPVEVSLQTFSPEKNLYHYGADLKRFRYYKPFPVRLPVMGKWFVSQGYGGQVTHRDLWRHALDFDIRDSDGRDHRPAGRELEDYYCYGKPVFAPARGRIVDIRDGIEDNVPGDSNTRENWGNTLVIEHGPQFYSQLSHLKPGSIRKSLGEYVERGEELGLCGNSGRSPLPHLHLQWQADPAIGSPTMPYPIGMFRSYRNGGAETVHLADVPRENETVEAIPLAKEVQAAFHFIPGQQIVWKNGDREAHWICETTPYNVAFLQDEQGGDRAYFLNNGQVHYFTTYEGKRGSLLYHFFLAHYQVPFVWLPGVTVEEELPLDLVLPPAARWWQDALGPFVQLLRVKHRLRFSERTSADEAEKTLDMEVVTHRMGREGRSYAYSSSLDARGLRSFTLHHPRQEKWVLGIKSKDHALQNLAMG